MADKICVVGLGYVGLPLAIALAKKFSVVGFDVNEKKIKQLKEGFDRTDEFTEDELRSSPVEFTSDEKRISESDFIIVAVPTPIDESKKPDLKYVESASQIVGRNIAKGSIVVFESTVYPGVTEEICAPIIEKESKLKCGEGFKIGYSPERVNPGDKEHTIERIVKIVSGMDDECLEKISSVYSAVSKAGIFKAKSIKVAEAAKVIENVQRDLNIALMNELSLIFERMGINTRDVIDAAATKWNFARYYPGMVGGHCIGVDPFYLTYKAKEMGYDPKVILAGRWINDHMPIHVSDEIIEMLQHGKDCTVLFMGLTFKENVPDLRNSKAKDMIDNLRKNGVEAAGYDPLLTGEEVKDNFGIENVPLDEIKDVDAIVVFSPHKEFEKVSLDELKRISKPNALLVDIKSFYDKSEALKKGFRYRCL